MFSSGKGTKGFLNTCEAFYPPPPPILYLIYLHLVLFILLFKVVLTFRSGNEILGMTICLKAVEQNLDEVSFLMFCKVTAAF